MNRIKHKILWIGFGNFAKCLFPHVIQRSNVEISSFFYPDRTEAIKRFGKKARWDAKKAISDPLITAVFITTPNDQHTEYLKLVLAYSKNIFVEKPITALFSEAAGLMPLVRKHKAALMVGHCKRREAEIRKMKEMIDNGAIGKVVSAYINASKGAAYSMDQSDWRFQKKRHREGPLITVGIHYVEVLHYLLGPVERLSATIKNISRQSEVPDSNAVLLNFQSGASAFLETNYNMPSEEILNVYGTEGSLYANRGNLYYRFGRDKDRVPSEANIVPLKKVDAIKEEINEFFDVIEGRGQIETGYREALNALAVIEACHQSSLNEKIVKMSDFPEYF